MALTFLQNGATRSGGPCLDAELLASYVDGRTTPGERIKVEAHVAHCEDCYFVFSETVQAQSTDDAVNVNSPSNSWRQWMSRVATGRAAAGLAAAAALVIVGRIYFPESSRPAQGQAADRGL